MNFSTISSNEKSSTHWTLVDTNLLICSLFIIVPKDELFKELSISEYHCSNRISGESILMDPWYLNKFFFLLNKPLIRQLAYNILQPLLNETTFIPFHLVNERKNSVDHQTLKKYLKKFKYFYKLFFLENSYLVKSRITEKEINFLAIKFLFTLIGV
jgi:hypothetical protein